VWVSSINFDQNNDISVIIDYSDLPCFLLLSDMWILLYESICWS